MVSMVSISVARHGSESTPSLIRRFSKRVQGSGIVRKAKSVRYRVRDLSKAKIRTGALRRIARDEKRTQMERLGLIEPRDARGRRPHK